MYNLPARRQELAPRLTAGVDAETATQCPGLPFRLFVRLYPGTGYPQMTRITQVPKGSTVTRAIAGSCPRQCQLPSGLRNPRNLRITRSPLEAKAHAR